MGKNLKGKECGKGICQRKDGSYYARFVDKYGKRHEKYVATLPEARNWLEEARFADTHDNILIPSDMTVDTWFEFWQEDMIADLALNTRRNYRERVCPQYSACDWWYVTPTSNLCTARSSSTGWKLTMLVQQFAKLILRWGQCLNQH